MTSRWTLLITVYHELSTTTGISNQAKRHDGLLDSNEPVKNNSLEATDRGIDVTLTLDTIDHTII
jgi:hypothetical protein